MASDLVNGLLGGCPLGRRYCEKGDEFSVNIFSITWPSLDKIFSGSSGGFSAINEYMERYFGCRFNIIPVGARVMAVRDFGSSLNAIVSM